MLSVDELVAQAKGLAKSMNYAYDLIEIHKVLNQGKGRRHREVALNRSVVVIAVASWQALVQDLARAMVKDMRPVHDEYEKPEYFRGAMSDWRRRMASVEESVGRYGTPNAENTRAVLLAVGYDPWKTWQWDDQSSESVRIRLSECLSVRHAIAHGDAFLPEVSVLGRTPSGKPTLWRSNAEECIAFFETLAKKTLIGGMR